MEDLPVAVTAGGSRRRVAPQVGNAAGLLAVCLLAGSAVGAVWGVLRPAYVATIGANGEITLDDSAGAPDSVDFVGYGMFVVVTLLLGLIVGIVVAVASSRQRTVSFTLPVMLWVGVVALAGSVACLVAGETMVSYLHADVMGQVAAGKKTVTYVPPVAPGVGFVAAPLAACWVYWVAACLAVGRGRPWGVDALCEGSRL